MARPSYLITDLSETHFVGSEKLLTLHRPQLKWFGGKAVIGQRDGEAIKVAKAGKENLAKTKAANAKKRVNHRVKTRVKHMAN